MSMIDSGETRRLKALTELGLLDTPAEPQFDAIVRAAAQHTDAPIAMITLVDDRRQWFKARIGTSSTENPIEESICAVTMRGAGVFVVPDASRDERFRDFPVIRGEGGVRFYAGAPLRMEDGTCLGALCVMDVEPREALTEAEALALESLARRTMSAIRMRQTMYGGDDGEAEPWLARAAALLDQAAIMLERADATAPLAQLEQVIAQIETDRARRAGRSG